MQKKQDGKTPLPKFVEEKLATKQELTQNDLERLQKVIIDNLTTLVSIELDRWIKCQHMWYQLIRTLVDNHLDIRIIGDKGFKDNPHFQLVPLKQETTMWYNSEDDVTAQSKNYFL